MTRFFRKNPQNIINIKNSNKKEPSISPSSRAETRMIKKTGVIYENDLLKAVDFSILFINRTKSSESTYRV